MRYVEYPGGVFPSTVSKVAEVRGSGAAYYVGTTQNLMVKSNQQFPPGSDLITGAGGFCDIGGQPPTPIPLRPAAVVDLSEFTGPFKVR
jgi:hypothetical protein